jgi:hypothetical protein
VTEPVPRLPRAGLAALCGLLAGGVTLKQNIVTDFPRDFGQVWFAARSIVHGVNPYPLVGPHLAYDWTWPLLYPLPAAVMAIPFAPLPLNVATVLFTTLIGAAFAWALMAHGYTPLFGFFSGALHLAAEEGQYSPLFAAAAVIPWLSLFLIAKPTIGAAIFVARPSWWAVSGALLFGAIAFAIQPHWVHDWLDAVARNNRQWAPQSPYRAPILFPGGVVALACLLRWRRPEARLVAALACVPQTTVLYEAVPLFLVPRTFLETTVLVVCSYLQHWFGRFFAAGVPTAQEHVTLSGRWLALSMYVPVTLMVLRRPNKGTLPAWLEERIARWPGWIRGDAA